MFTLYIANAFSLSMLSREAQANGTPAGYLPRAGEFPGVATRVPRPLENASAFVKHIETAGNGTYTVQSIVGHADTARLFESVLKREVPANRATVKLDPTDILVVGQYIGPRLEEGATTLPEGATIEWWVV